MFTLIFNQLLKMFLIMVLAFFCYRIKIVDQQGNRAISNILLLIVNPCLIITVFQTDYDPELTKGLLISFAVAATSIIIAILVSQLLISKKAGSDYSLERFAAIYSNCGFIGIPLIHSALGNEGVFYLSAYMAVFNIFTWTHGLGLLEGKFSVKYIKKGLLSPMVIAALTGILLYFLKIRIPETVLESMNYITNTNTPLAMMVAGFSVAQADLKHIFTKRRIYWVCFLKLIVVPLTIVLFLAAAKIPHTVACMALIASACPTATTLTMMAIRYDKNYTYASEIFSFTTVLSIVTIPVVTYLAGFLL